MAAAIVDSSHQSRESRSIVVVVRMPKVVPEASDFNKSKIRTWRRVITQPVVNAH